jgi:hypothetical protein
MKPKDRKVRGSSGASQAQAQQEEVLSNFPNTKNMGWLMADAVDSIYDLFD